MNSPASLLSSLVADYSTPPTFVDRTYGEPLFHTESEVLAVRYAPDESLWTVEEAGLLRHWTPDGRLIGVGGNGSDNSLLRLQRPTVAMDSINIDSAGQRQSLFELHAA